MNLVIKTNLSNINLLLLTIGLKTFEKSMNYRKISNKTYYQSPNHIDNYCY